MTNKKEKFQKFLEEKELTYSSDFTGFDKVIDQSSPNIIREILASDNLADSVNFVQLQNGIARIDPFISQSWTRVVGTCSTFVDSATMSHEPILLQGKYMKYETALCKDELRQYFYGYENVGDANDNSIPLEADFVAQGMSYVARDISNVFWRGASGFTSIISKALTAGAATASFNGSVSTSASNGVIAMFDAMIAALDPDIWMDSDLTLYVGLDTFLNYLQSWRNIGNYHIDSAKAQLTGYPLFNHPNIMVKPQFGLTAQSKALLTKKEYIIMGGDRDPMVKTFNSYYDFNSDKTLYRYKHIFASAVVPAGNRIVVAQ